MDVAISLVSLIGLGLICFGLGFSVGGYVRGARIRYENRR